jgi:DNA-binding MarR family transcriptional regulator/GNAT superfamily N-acetyltransferase
LLASVGMIAATEEASRRIEELRAFNRFWTGVIHVLNDGLLDTPYTLTEARVIYELAQSDALDQLTLRHRLDLDAGYLSRIVARFKLDGLVETEPSAEDGRRQIISLTDRGREVFALLDQRSAEENGSLLAQFSEHDQGRLIGAMATIRQIVEPAGASPPFALRAPREGDYGWVVQRHGTVYAAEFGWDETFESLVARIVADYIENREPERENAWIAELRGEPVGCVFCLSEDEHTAKLRILLVDPSARGLGIGRELVDAVVTFARDVGYRRLVLWTNDVLTSARRIYEAAGFRLVREEPHTSFGHHLVGQHWQLDLEP